MEDDDGEFIEDYRLVNELLQSFHETGMYLPTRTIFLGSEIVTVNEGESGTDSLMAEKFIKNLHVLENLSAKPITIIQNNLGGDEYHGAAIIDAIKQSPCHITIVVRGHAMSMGSIILQCADHRVMGPNATQMCHYGTWGTHDHSKNAQQHAKEGQRIDLWMEGVYMKRLLEKDPNFTLEDLRKMLYFDTYLTAQQSIDLGLCDEIG